MIKQLDLGNLMNIDSVERIYEELLLNGIDAIPAPSKEAKIRIFSKLCHDLVQQYILWNDYIHSNNIMQLFKSIAFKDNAAQKPLWFVRYEIIVYGRRTPLYFIDNPKVFFEKINTICASDKANQIEKLCATVESLFAYYQHNFLSQTVNAEDRDIFIQHFKNKFSKEYNITNKNKFPTEIISIIESFVKYSEKPLDYLEPGITKELFKLWDEDDEVIFGAVPVENNQSEPKIQPTEVEELPDEELGYLKSKTIRFIGSLNKSSIKNKLVGISKKYGFNVEIYDDYEKITNMDFRNMKYNSRINGIIAGPMPHSIKGMGSYSSGLEMLKSEPGYPPVVECIAGDTLKVSSSSIWKALKELNNALKSTL